MAKNPKSDGTKLIVQNRRARYDYHLDDYYEAGIELTGTEVKSLRDGKASLAEAWVKIDDLFGDRAQFRVVAVGDDHARACRGQPASGNTSSSAS